MVSTIALGLAQRARGEATPRRGRGHARTDRHPFAYAAYYVEEEMAGLERQIERAAGTVPNLKTA
jgi:hypothetical protein